MIKSQKFIADNQFIKNWNCLNPKQKKSRILRSYLVIRKMASVQIQYLKLFEKSPNEKNIGFLYFINTVEEIWRQADFAIQLGKGKNKKFSFYPVRTILENTLRLNFYSSRDKAKQDNIAARELMRICKRFYDFSKASNETNEEMKNFYNDFSNWGNISEDIEEFNSSDKVFPDIKKLSTDFFSEKKDVWYHFYQYLAESCHGKLFSIIIAKNNEDAEHARVSMMMLMICCQVLIITDKHMGEKYKPKVIEAIDKSRAIIKK